MSTSPSLNSFHKINNNNDRRLSFALSPREIKRFVASYRKHELLWNTKCPQYTIPVSRNEALTSIAQEMGKNWTESLVKSKWNQLKSQYRRELAKLSEPCRGSPEADNLASKWWLFGLMDSFLRPHTTLRNGTTYMSTPNEDKGRQPQLGQILLLHQNMGVSSEFPIESLKMEDISPGPSYEGVDDSQDGCIESGGSLDGCLEPEPDNNLLLMREASPTERVEEASCFSLSSDRNLQMLDMGNTSSNNSQVMGQTRDPDEMFSAWLLSELGQIDDEYMKDELKIELMRKCNEAKRICRLRKMQSASHMNRPIIDHHMTRSVSPQLSARPMGLSQHSPHPTQINRTT